MDKNKKILFFGLVFFALVIVVLFYGKGTKENAKAIVNFSDSTVAPSHDAAFNPGACMCPSTGADLVMGSIDAAPLIGQVKQEGNSPYDYNACRKDAVEMLEFLQDQEIFQYAQSITRNELGEFPPKELYYSWDQKAGKCNFFFSCPGMTRCSDNSVVSGKVD
jgi:hypothetical protein